MISISKLEHRQTITCFLIALAENLTENRILVNPQPTHFGYAEFVLGFSSESVCVYQMGVHL